VDENDHRRTDATGNLSDTTIATITTASSPVLTAVAVGQVTLTAHVGGVSAQVQVNALGEPGDRRGQTGRFLIPDTLSMGVRGMPRIIEFKRRWHSKNCLDLERPVCPCPGPVPIVIPVRSCERSACAVEEPLPHRVFFAR
jgi:hypothetical protein